MNKSIPKINYVRILVHWKLFNIKCAFTTCNVRQCGALEFKANQLLVADCSTEQAVAYFPDTPITVTTALTTKSGNNVDRSLKHGNE